MLIDLVDNERQSFNPARKDLAERASPGLKAKRICLTRVIQLSHQAVKVARMLNCICINFSHFDPTLGYK